MAADAGVPLQATPSQGLTLAYNTRSRDEVDAVLAQAEALGGTCHAACTGSGLGGAITATSQIRTASFGRSLGTQASPYLPMEVSAYRSSGPDKALPKQAHHQADLASGSQVSDFVH